VRWSSLVVVAGLVAGGAVTTAPAASAVGTCSMLVPSRFSINQYARNFTVPQGRNCAAAGVADAFWFAYHPTKGAVNLGAAYVDGARSTQIALIDTMPVGKWTWKGSLATDAAYSSEVFQYPAYTDVRLGSSARIIPTRAGTKVNLRTKAMRYWQRGHKFIGWSGARGRIEYRTPGTSVWRPLKEVYSTSTGAYSYTYRTTAVREYRVVFTTVPTIWGSTSPVRRR
jgi:hypothetical protein